MLRLTKENIYNKKTTTSCVRGLIHNYIIIHSKRCLIFLYSFSCLWTAPQVSGWDVSVINITVDSFHLQWPKLTSEISQPVRVYVVIVASTTRSDHGGRIVSSSTSSLRIPGLSTYHDYRIIVVAVDKLGQPHKSSETRATTEESGQYSYPALVNSV